MKSPNIKRMAHKAKSLGGMVPAADAIANDSIKTQKQIDRNKMLRRKGLVDGVKFFS
jgi:hypothetical protein